MSKTSSTSRRDFLKAGAAATAGAALAGGLSIARSAHAAGGEEIKIALVGCGARGSGAAENCMSADPQIKLVAMADLFQDRIDISLKNLKKIRPSQIDVPPEQQFVGFGAFEKAIECAVDLVLLCTPPGFRPAQYAAAVKAGKNVFLEKPVCVDAPGFRSLMESNKLADEKGLKVAVGLQRRHSKEYQAGIQKIHDGSVGDLLLLRAYWNSGNYTDPGGFGPRDGAREMEFQIRHWNYFRWLSGDHIVEQHVHNIDICNWAKNAHPVEANGMGGRAVRKKAQIFDHHMVEFTYADGSRLLSECRQVPGCWDFVKEVVHGVKGTAQLGFYHPDAFQAEHRDLIAAIRGGQKLNDGWHGATSSMTAVLGRMATYSGQVVAWDDAVAKGPSEMPEKLAFDANPPQMPDPDGSYPVPVPGIYKPY